MKIALLGYGKMGKSIEQISLQEGHTVVARVGNQSLSNCLEIDQADVCIDFSHPSVVIEHIQYLSKIRKPMVIGTTGWYQSLHEVEELVKKSQTGLIWAPNFSLGIQLFVQVVSEAAKLLSHFPEYDVSGLEMHHSQKADSPSGTAKAIAERLISNHPLKKKIIYDTINRKVDPDELHFPSLRSGSIPGTHTVIFDSPSDTITLTHQARNREGFAYGAVKAAEWIVPKKGIYTLENLIQNMLSRSSYAS